MSRDGIVRERAGLFAQRLAGTCVGYAGQGLQDREITLVSIELIVQRQAVLLPRRVKERRRA